MYPNQFLDIALLQPPRPEQDQIVAYLRAQDAKADLYWLRTLPTGYTADADGLAKPDGSRVKMGDSVTATGTLSWAPLDRQCENGHTCG